MKTARPMLPRLVLVAIVAIVTCFQLEAAILHQRPIVPSPAAASEVLTVAAREASLKNNEDDDSVKYLQLDQSQLVSAALEQEKLKPDRTRILVEQQPLLLPEEKAREHRKLKQHISQKPKRLGLPSTKFLILTTGDKIKLYPFESSAQLSSQVNLSGNYYEIRSAFEVDASSPKLINSKQLGNSTFARYLAERKLLSSRSSSSSSRRSGQARSILPARHDIYDEDEAVYAGQLGWKRPWITDVDYFFDAAFCPSELGSGYHSLSKRHCLVIVWLDNSNKYVRFGSLDLTKSSIESLALPRSSSGTRDQPLLLLHEFAPIELFRRAELRQASNEGQVFSIVVDRRRSMLHVALSDGSQPTPNRILTGKLRATTSLEGPAAALPTSTVEAAGDEKEMREEQLVGERLLSFNYCSGRKQLNLEEASFENLNVDEENGNWLFYFDKHTGGKIFALSFKQSADRLQQSSAAIQALVRDTASATLENDCDDAALAVTRWPSVSNSNNDIADSHHHQDDTNGSVSNNADRKIEQQPVTNRQPRQKKARNATGMAVDSKQRLIYWLNEANELFSCNYAGLETKLVGRLSARPAIRDPNAMQVFQGALYISDPIKKSLIAYTLPNEVTRATTTNTDDNNRRRDISEQPEIRATHQVLLVEMPSLYGFRLVDIEALEAELIGSAGCINGESSALSENSKDGGLSKGVVFSPMGDSDDDERVVRSEGPTDRYAAANHYEKHLLNRLANALSPDQCGYEQSDYERRTITDHDDKFLFLLIELGILHLAFLIWLSYPWLKAKLLLLRSTGSSNNRDSKTEFCKGSDLMFKCPV